jgi:hypothetical protein
MRPTTCPDAADAAVTLTPPLLTLLALPMALLTPLTLSLSLRWR